MCRNGEAQSALFVVVLEHGNAQRQKKFVAAGANKQLIVIVAEVQTSKQAPASGKHCCEGANKHRRAVSIVAREQTSTDERKALLRGSKQAPTSGKHCCEGANKHRRAASIVAREQASTDERQALLL